METVGLPELLLILAIVVLLFGPSRLPGIAQSLGRSIREFKRALNDETEDPKASPKV